MTAAAMPPRPWLYPAEVSERLGLSEVTLANWRNAAKGPKFIKIGKRVGYPIKEFIEWERSLLDKKSQPKTRKRK